MADFDKFECDGEIYYYYNNKFVDSTFVELTVAENNKVANYYFEKEDYENFDTKGYLALL